jgi:general secretion pathway protein J
MRQARGFTLIELMVAMAIVAIIGVVGLTGIRNVISQQEIAEERAARWREIQLAMRIIVQDLSQVHPRTTRDEQGLGPRASFLADPTHQFALEFSRGGWTNPAGFPRGTVLRVAYDIEQDTLVRFYWPVADRTLATEPVRQELLTGITAMDVTYFDDNGSQSIDWPPLNAGGGPPAAPGGGGSVDRPRAVEFALELEDLGRIWRLVETKS